jgi:hypothetical protein
MDEPESPLYEPYLVYYKYNNEIRVGNYLATNYDKFLKNNGLGYSMFVDTVEITVSYELEYIDVPFNFVVEVRNALNEVIPKSSLVRLL